MRAAAAELARTAALALVLGLPAAVADAQLGGHGMLPPARPLHERLARAEVVAIGRVSAIEPGRIRVEQAQPFRGEPGASFAIKRAPSAPPELLPGQWAVLLLRGARSPYVLVDEPRELQTLDDAQARARWVAILGTMLSDDTEGRIQTYLAWVHGDDDTLRSQALRALMPLGAGELPLSDAQREALVETALDRSKPDGPRTAAVSLAMVHPGTLQRVLEGLTEPEPDLERLRVGYRMAGLRRTEGITEAVTRGLRHGDPRVRKVALAGIPSFASEPRLRQALVEMVENDPEEELRILAARALRHPVR